MTIIMTFLQSTLQSTPADLLKPKETPQPPVTAVLRREGDSDDYDSHLKLLKEVLKTNPKDRDQLELVVHPSRWMREPARIALWKEALMRGMTPDEHFLLPLLKALSSDDKLEKDKAIKRIQELDREIEEWIVSLQRCLKDAGFYHGPIDGIFGRRTRMALRQYQVTHGISDTGVLDEATRRALGLS